MSQSGFTWLGVSLLRASDVFSRRRKCIRRSWKHQIPGRGMGRLGVEADVLSPTDRIFRPAALQWYIALAAEFDPTSEPRFRDINCHGHDSRLHPAVIVRTCTWTDAIRCNCNMNLELAAGIEHSQLATRFDPSVFLARVAASGPCPSLSRRPSQPFLCHSVTYPSSRFSRSRARALTS